MRGRKISTLLIGMECIDIGFVLALHPFDRFEIAVTVCKRNTYVFF